MVGHRKLFGSALTAAALWAAPVMAQGGADTRPTVAVMYFNNGALGTRNAELEPLTKGIADMMITQLAVNSAIRVVERDQLQKLLQEQQLGQSGSVDRETAVRVGRILGAQHMIFGGFVTDPSGQTMRLVARAVNVETSQIEYVETVSDKPDNLFAMIDRLAERMNRGMRLPAPPARARGASAPAPAQRLPFRTALLYSRAITAQDAGNTQHAVELYQQVVQEFPDYAPAVNALRRLRTSPGQSSVDGF